MIDKDVVLGLAQQISGEISTAQFALIDRDAEAIQSALDDADQLCQQLTFFILDESKEN